MKIRVAEIFYSLQGEGLYQGVPSVFLRTFGCNFRCKNFGLPRSAPIPEGPNAEVAKVIDNIDQYKSYDELPLVHTGCDSYPSWDPRFKHLSPMLTTDEIVERIKTLLPNGHFYDNIHFIITGGEPLLGWQRAYPELLEKLVRECNLQHVTFETNGTQKLQQPLIDFFEGAGSVGNDIQVTFSISSKLTNSGEKWSEAIRPAVVADYTHIINHQIYFKWVCSNPEDLIDVEQAVGEYKAAGLNYPVYLMPAGGSEKLYYKNRQWLSKICLAHGYRYSPRLQIDLYGNGWGT